MIFLQWTTVFQASGQKRGKLRGKSLSTRSWWRLKGYFYDFLQADHFKALAECLDYRNGSIFLWINRPFLYIRKYSFQIIRDSIFVALYYAINITKHYNNHLGSVTNSEKNCLPLLQPLELLL